MHRGPQAEVVPKTLHGIFAAEECIKLQKDFPFPLFNFHKVLRQRFLENKKDISTDNKLAKLRRHTSRRVRFGSKKFGPN